MSKLTFNAGGAVKTYRFRKIRFWAEDGMICWVDEKDGEENTMSTADFRDRAKAMLSLTRRPHYQDEKRAHAQAARDMIECCQEADRQKGAIKSRRLVLPTGSAGGKLWVPGDPL